MHGSLFTMLTYQFSVSSPVLKNTINLFLVLIMSFTLISCGGGGGNGSGLPLRPADDIEAPIVVQTMPTSGFYEFNTSEFIVITFNENIATVDTNQVYINRIVGTTVESTTVPLKINDEFSFDDVTNELTIKPSQNSLLGATKYQVTIQNIKDTSNNVMTTPCLLIFATVGHAPITTGKTGLCGSDPNLNGVPGAPQVVNATSSEVSATVTWQAPISGGPVLEYIVEKTTGAGNNTFVRLTPTLSNTVFSFTDPAKLKLGESYTYRVIAKNKSGEGVAVLSNSIVPTQTIIIPGAVVQLTAAVKYLVDNATVTVNWSAPVTGSTVVEYIIERKSDAGFISISPNLSNATFSYFDDTVKFGSSYTYRITPKNSAGLGPIRISNTVTPTALIVAPGVPTVTAVEGNNTATVFWQAPTTGGAVVSYTVEKSINSGAFKTLKTLIKGEFSLIDSNALNGQNITYQVLAINSAGSSLPGVSNTVTPKRAVGIPGTPKSVIAVAGASSVKVTWVAPDSIDLATYYKVQKSIDNGRNFIDVDTNVLSPKVTIIDPNVKNTVAHLYRVFAGNSAGLNLTGVTSNAVIPVAKILELKPSLIIISKVPVTGNNFGKAIAFSADNKILAVGEIKGEVPGSPIDSGTLQLFDNTSVASGTSWTWSETIPSPNAGTGFAFGSAVAISPDGLNMAVGTPGKWSIYKYKKTNAGWTSAGITSQGAGSATTSTFGNSVAYSTNGAELAVGDYLNRSVNILYTNGGQRLGAQVFTPGSQYGASVTYSPDGSTFAVAEPKANSSTGIASTGNVLLYTISAKSVWAYLVTLESQTPTTNNQFGGEVKTHAVAFSPDSLMLAIGESLADPGGMMNAGTVQIFVRSSINNNTWTYQTTLTEQTPAANNQFGISVAFSPNGKTLAIGTKLGDVGVATDAGTVELFTLSGLNWLPSRKLTSQSPATGKNFGAPIAFSSDGSLAIAEVNGDASTKTTGSGNVNIFGAIVLP